MSRFFAAVALAAALALCGAATRAAAQAQPTAEALRVASELTSLMSASTTSEMMKNINEKMWPSIEASVRRQHPDIDAATMGELRREIEKLQTSAVRDSMEDAAAIYARHFSVEEMRAMIAFYRSPAGAKSLALLPSVQAELARAMAPRLQGLQAKLTLAYLDILQRKGLSPR